ncbi:transcription factor bHLH91-like [Humulus lupulus]|uniref:transcription factor bHLH91-like n=1 Tax=Humulus lupulus TaxID=3486 RepID=UPI002B40C420|nr:transcription factor bHLH91-like [Humulus lupulus]
MYVDDGSCSFDPNDTAEATAGGSEDGFNSQMPPLLPSMNGFSAAEELAYHQQQHQHLPHSQEEVAIDMELQQQLAFSMENSYNIDINSTSQLVSFDHLQQQQEQPQWDNQDMAHNNIHRHQLQEPADLLNLFHLPRCSASSSSSITFANPTPKTDNFPSTSLAFLGDVPMGMDSSSSSSVLYDPLLHLNLPPQPPLFKDLFQSLPDGYAFPSAASRNGSLVSNGAMDMDGEGSGGVYQDGPEGMQFENGVLEFARDRACIDKGRDGRGTKHFASERHRRVQMSDKYQLLKSLVPNPTKNDRASIVGDAIEYIRELRRTVNELKILVEKKRRGIEANKRQKSEEDTAGEVENCNVKPDPDQSYIRSSWLQRKSKDTEVDVRIIDDEVTIKFVQRKKINLLLTASRVLDELQLDLRHVAGGHVGDTYSFLFNTKIYDGSSLYASAIANKLIDILDRQFTVIVPPTTSY